MKKLVLAAFLASSMIVAPALAADAVAAYSTGATDIGTLLDTPATRAVLDKHMPQLAAHPQIEMARPMTLKQVQQFASDMITDDLLAKVDADLATIAKAQ
jgi:hypothetical protein